MADDDIERLLREIASQDGPRREPETARRADLERASGRAPGGRIAFAVMCGVVLGVVAWGVGLVLPFVSAVSSGIGGALAAFVTALVAGPPRWFSS